MRQVIGVEQMSEKLAVGADAAEADTAEIHAVVAARTTDELGFCRDAFLAPVRTRHLQCGIDGLGTGVGEEHMV